MTPNASLADTFTYKLAEVFEHRIDYDSMDIWQALNHNDKGGLWITFFNDSVGLGQIRTIFKTYILIELSDNKTPVYDAIKNKTPEMQNLLKFISGKSGQALKLTERVMNQLYWYTKQGVISYSDILDPRSAVANYGSRVHPAQPLKAATESIENILSGSKSLFDSAVKGVGGLSTIIQFLPFILVGGFIIGGGIYLYQFMPKKQVETK